MKMKKISMTSLVHMMNRRAPGWKKSEDDDDDVLSQKVKMDTASEGEPAVT